MADSDTAPDQKNGLDFQQRFVEGLFDRKKGKDTSFKAKLRRSASPSQQHLCWDILASWGIDLTKDLQRVPYQTIAALVGFEDASSNGSTSFAKALRGVYESSDQAEARLRRLLNCDTADELCRIVLQTAPLIRSHFKGTVDYTALARDLRWFESNPDRVKINWASDFYYKPSHDAENGQTQST